MSVAEILLLGWFIGFFIAGGIGTLLVLAGRR